MALAKDLEIYKTATELLKLCLEIQSHIPRALRLALGQRISNESADIVILVARANVARGDDREKQIAQLLERLEAVTLLLRAGHELKAVFHNQWARSIELTDSIGKQAGGWLKSTRANPATPAA